MKPKSPKRKPETLPEPAMPEKSKRWTDPDEVEQDLEQKNQVLKKMISRLKQK
jgi:hypothetical protein